MSEDTCGVWEDDEEEASADTMILRAVYTKETIISLGCRGISGLNLSCKMRTN